MTPSPERTIRLTLAGVILAVLLIGGVGVAGGLLGQLLLPPSATPLSSDNRLATTVQQVTISPNTAAVQAVDKAARSTVLLGSGSTNAIVATGSVITNDGVVVTTGDFTAATTVAFDDRGVVIPLELIGKDPLFGLTYFRLRDSVFPPAQLRAEDPAVGHQLLAVSRSAATFQVRVNEYLLEEYVVANEATAPALSRLASGTINGESGGRGSPLIDEEGRVAALLTEGSQGRAIPVRLVQESLNRVVSEKREYDPLREIGITVRHEFIHPTESEALTFAATVTSVITTSPARAAGIEVGDSIIAVNDQPLTWNVSPATLLATKQPISLKISRAEQLVTVTIGTP